MRSLLALIAVLAFAGAGFAQTAKLVISQPKKQCSWQLQSKASFRFFWQVELTALWRDNNGRFFRPDRTIFFGDARLAADKPLSVTPGLCDLYVQPILIFVVSGNSLKVTVPDQKGLQLSVQALTDGKIGTRQRLDFTNPENWELK